MRQFNIAFLLVVCTAVFSNVKIVYEEPKAGSEYVFVKSNIIIGFDQPLSLTDDELLNCIKVTGKGNFIYQGKVKLAENKTKLIYQPVVPFRYNDEVTVNITGKLLKLISSSHGKNGYAFKTSVGRSDWDYEKFIKKEFHLDELTPTDGPQLIVSAYNDPAPGKIFTAPWDGSTFLYILNNNGSVYWEGMRGFFSGDFKVQPNGYLTYFGGDDKKHFMMDQNYNVIDTFTCGNGYVNDIHELKVLTNGHVLLMAYDPEIVDMRGIVEGGCPNATVIGLIIQELDNQNQVVFQWRSWDHIAITDATHENLLDSVIDYIHGNAIEPDKDGNLLISSRHTDEITKIDRTTGEIVWRLGGKHNYFTFINDAVGFSHQHDIRRIANGNITLYDNGNFHTPQYSRVLEYELDEENFTATKVWQYRHTPDVFGSWGGNAQRLSNGNTFISWGGANKTMTEVNPSGQIVFEASFAPGVYSYRSYKFEWPVAPLGTENNNGNIRNFVLYQNYPNPFNPSTELSFNISMESSVSLIVYDITGKSLETIVDGKLNAGVHKFTWDGSKYASGVYMYRLIAGGYSETRKMLMLK